MKKVKAARLKRFAVVLVALAVAAFPFCLGVSASTAYSVDLTNLEVSSVKYYSSSGSLLLSSSGANAPAPSGNRIIYNTSVSPYRISVYISLGNSRFAFNPTSSYTFSLSVGAAVSLQRVNLMCHGVNNSLSTAADVGDVVLNGKTSGTISGTLSPTQVSAIGSMSAITLTFYLSKTEPVQWFYFHKTLRLTEKTASELVIESQDKNKQEIISNQDKNASDIKANQDKNAADIKANQDKNAADIKANQDKNTDKITGNKDPDVSGAGEKADEVQGEIEDYDKKEKETIDLLDKSLDEAFLKFNPFKQYNFFALSSAFMAFTSCFNGIVTALGVHFTTVLSVSIVAGSFAVVVGIVINPRNSDRK